MSGLINKVKEVLHSDNSHDSTTTHNTHSTTSGAPEGTHGPHSSRVANAADPRVDSDRDGSHNTGAHHTGGHGEYGSSTGGYMHGTGVGAHTGTRESEHGPHSSRAANALDPRVDSDRDGSNNYGSASGGYTHGTGPTHASYDTGLQASSGSAGFGSHTHGNREGEHGPHSSRVANAVDPRVDSDRDGSRNAGAAYGTGHSTGNTFGSSGHTGTSGFTTGSNAGTREGEHGPHSSRTANALDPRVDSDRDGSHNTGASYGTGHSSGNTFGTGHSTGTTGHSTGNTFGTSSHTGTSGFTTGSNAGTREGEHGPHSSRTANALDPRVDSDRDGSHNTGAGYGTSHSSGNTFGTGHNTGVGHSSHSGPGPAPNTAGPHKSDMVNKLDPRVDSDLDGSKTVGGNKTYQ
jgi:hypothetical protein